jgi:hypothetical protein
MVETMERTNQVGHAAVDVILTADASVCDDAGQDDLPSSEDESSFQGSQDPPSDASEKRCTWTGLLLKGINVHLWINGTSGK